MAARKKRKTKAKTKTDEMKQTHGMVEEEKYEPTPLDQLWGSDGMQRYNTMDLQVYQDELKHMNKADLKAHAIKIGLLPIDNMEQLKARLEREFKKHVNSFRKPVTGNHPLTTRSADQDVMDILAEGR